MNTRSLPVVIFNLYFTTVGSEPRFSTIRLNISLQDFLDFLSNRAGMNVTLDNIYFINDAHLIEVLLNKSKKTALYIIFKRHFL